MNSFGKEIVYSRSPMSEVVKFDWLCNVMRSGETVTLDGMKGRIQGISVIDGTPDMFIVKMAGYRTGQERLFEVKVN